MLAFAFFAVSSTLLFAALVAYGKVFAADDGNALIKSRCNACHTTDKGDQKRRGSDLRTVIGRKVGAVAGFPYMNGLREAGLPWTPQRLDRRLAGPHSFISDTFMLDIRKDRATRSNFIAYLATNAQ